MSLLLPDSLISIFPTSELDYSGKSLSTSILPEAVPGKKPIFTEPGIQILPPLKKEIALRITCSMGFFSLE